MKPILLLFFYGITLVLAGQQSSHLGAAKYAPGNGKKLLIIGQDLGAVGGLDAYADGYVDHMNSVPAGVTSYTGFPSLTGLRNMANWGSGDVNAQAYVEDETFDHSFIVIGLHLVDQLGSVISGDADSQIEDLAGWIRDQERPIFLRIGYEFDGPWNHYDPDDFKEAWIYIVDYFDRLDVRNVAYVWQAYGGNTANIGRWYPGDSYVNWMGYSHFDEPAPGANILAFASEHDKPVMIAESAPRRDLMTGDGGEHWSAWFEPLFSEIYNNPRIKALAYINVNWDSQPMWQDQGWGDSRVQVNETVKINWQSEIEKDVWILAIDSLFEELDYQRWQDSTIVAGDQVLKEESTQELILRMENSCLFVQTPRKQLMEELRIWTMDGRLKRIFSEASNSYEIPADSRGFETVVIQVRIGRQLISRRAIW